MHADFAHLPARPVRVGGVGTGAVLRCASHVSAFAHVYPPPPVLALSVASNLFVSNIAIAPVSLDCSNNISSNNNNSFASNYNNNNNKNNNKNNNTICGVLAVSSSSSSQVTMVNVTVQGAQLRANYSLVDRDTVSEGRQMKIAPFVMYRSFASVTGVGGSLSLVNFCIANTSVDVNVKSSNASAEQNDVRASGGLLAVDKTQRSTFLYMKNCSFEDISVKLQLADSRNQSDSTPMISPTLSGAGLALQIFITSLCYVNYFLSYYCSFI